MFALGSGALTALWILVVLATVATAGLTVLLERNLVYGIRRLFPSERRMGGRPPRARSRAVWTTYWVAVSTMVVGTAVAGTARGPARAEAPLAVAEEVAAALGSAELHVAVAEGVLAPAEDPHRHRIDSLRRRMAPALLAPWRSRDLLHQAAALEDGLSERPLRRPAVRSGELSAVGERIGEDLSEFERALESLGTATNRLVATLRDGATELAGTTDDGRVGEAERAVAAAMAEVTGRLGVVRELGRGLLERVDIPVEESAFWLAGVTPIPGASGRAVPQGSATSSALVRLRDSLREEGHRAEVERLRAELALADSLVRIRDDDPWDVVVGKAIGLRQLGRIEDARAAFARYGELFSSSDPSAAAYAHTARAFTARAAALGLLGGAYLYAVEEGGPAWRAGLRAGDILVRLGGTDIDGADAFVRTVGKAPAGRSLEVVFLRLRSDGTFDRRGATVPGGPLRVGAMPI